MALVTRDAQPQPQPPPPHPKICHSYSGTRVQKSYYYLCLDLPHPSVPLKAHANLSHSQAGLVTCALCPTYLFPPKCCCSDSPTKDDPIQNENKYSDTVENVMYCFVPIHIRLYFRCQKFTLCAKCLFLKLWHRQLLHWLTSVQ